MIPQAQLTYSHLSFDRFYDEHNVKVNLEKGESLEGRLGVAFNYDHSDPGDIYRFQTYVLPNVYYEFLDGSEVKVAGLKYENKDDRFWGGLSLGATVDWCDAYSLYGEVTARTGLENFGDSHEFAGEAGFRLSF